MWVLGEAEDDPGGGGGGGVLTCHEEGDHHVCDFVVGNGDAVFVNALHQVPNHVLRILAPPCSAVVDDGEIGVGHHLVGVVAPPVLREWHPWEHEVYGLEAGVEGVEVVCECGVHLSSDFFALESS